MDPTPQLLDISEQLDQLVAMMAGYRAKLEGAGFSPTAAEEMTIHYHASIIIAIFAKIGKKS